jgi:hypothetical protein
MAIHLACCAFLFLLCSLLRSLLCLLLNLLLCRQLLVPMHLTPLFALLFLTLVPPLLIPFCFRTTVSLAIAAIPTAAASVCYRQPLCPFLLPPDTVSAALLPLPPAVYCYRYHQLPFLLLRP